MNVAVSIVTPTHNTRDLTIACLRSIERASPEATEVILVDDGSADDTLIQVRDAFPNVKIVSHSPAAGFTIAANRGLREASGELLLLLNSDTEIYADTLPRMRQAFADNPRLGAAGAALHFPDGSPQWSGASEPGILWIFTLTTGLATLLDRLPGYRRMRSLEAERARRVDWVSGAAMVIRRSAWSEVGELDERFHFYAQDLDYCMRLRNAGWEVRIIAEARVLHHSGSSIGKRSGIVKLRYNPELLWTDLVRFYAKRYGPRRARFFSGLMRWGGWLRVQTRRLARPLIEADQRAQWDRDTAAFSRAIDALSKL
jgi:N-acetylglucosaminyl-diphospho-decaprenol L-rhamnosyltransferase